YRRKNSDLYNEIKCGEYNTQAWHKVCSIKDFVYRFPSPFGNWNKYLDSIGKVSQNSIVDMIENANLNSDGILLPLKPDRLQWSFPNGIYTAVNNKFWEYDKKYDDPTCPFATGRPSINY